MCFLRASIRENSVSTLRDVAEIPLCRLVYCMYLNPKFLWGSYLPYERSAVLAMGDAEWALLDPALPLLLRRLLD